MQEGDTLERVAAYSYFFQFFVLVCFVCFSSTMQDDDTLNSVAQVLSTTPEAIVKLNFVHSIFDHPYS